MVLKNILLRYPSRKADKRGNHGAVWHRYYQGQGKVYHEEYKV
jgi:hypothetical protein